jgi:8-oxo-dGTP pyrophosphatase MutT (NUDIX family)
LYQYLTHTAWVDVVDARNHSTGMRLPIAWATDRGLWHRGVHVVVRTTDGKYVVGKRVRSIVFAPGMLQVSLGGGVDSGEQPLHAAQRETHEELGILLREHDFQPLFMHRHASYHPHYHKRSKVHVYVYAATLPLHSSQLRPQPGEVEELRLVSARDVRRLVRTHRLRNFGRLEWPYKFYRKALSYSNQPF